MNKVILIGRLGKDPELRTLESGASVANFSLATNEKYKDRNGEYQERTEWHNCTAWGKRAEVIEKYVQKGQHLIVEGKINTDKWTDSDGNERRSTKIVVTNFEFIGGASANGSTVSSEKNSYVDDTEKNPLAGARPKVDEDLPF